MQQDFEMISSQSPKQELQECTMEEQVILSKSWRERSQLLQSSNKRTFGQAFPYSEEISDGKLTA